MRSRKVAKAILILVFVALLAAPVLIRRLNARRHQANASIGAAAAKDRYGFHLEEVAQTSGVNFVHQAPTLDRRLDHIMPQVASMGAGVSIVDFDRDGWPDIYV
ncbi:MAG TPA: VCBS repeat-containing protein, partial [Pyrinomonadaceae bacterium]|nr:VCBS repeat-containing protein [Pyrinomonadaceae bacterium]